MKTESTIKLGMNVHLILYGPDRKIKDERRGHNIVTNVGLAHIADRLSSSPGEAAMGYMAIGTGTTPASAGNTTLVTETHRHALTSFTDSGAVVTYIASFAAGHGTNALTEAGIFNDVTAGTLLCRLVFDVINKGASDTLQITWTLTASDDGVA